MNELIRAALVIARRDYVATVWSKSFLLFLVGPFFPLLIGAIFAIVGAGSGAPPVKPPVAVIATADEGAAIEAARTRFVGALTSGSPTLRIVAPEGSGDAQAHRLLAGPVPAADVVLIAEASPPLLIGAPDRVAAAKSWLALLLDEAGKSRALARAGRPWSPVPVATQALAPAAAAAAPADDRAPG